MGGESQPHLFAHVRYSWWWSLLCWQKSFLLLMQLLKRQNEFKMYLQAYSLQHSIRNRLSWNAEVNDIMRKAKRHCLTSKVLSSKTESTMKQKVWISKAALLLDQERLVPHATRSTATLLQAALRMSPGPSQDHATPRLAKFIGTNITN